MSYVEESETIAKDAVDYIIEQTKKYKSHLLIVTTGPLTNLARAIDKEPKIMKYVGRIVTMGGAVASPGNVNKFAEAHIAVDPDAADFVFKSRLPITLVGLDVTRKTLLNKDNVKEWERIGPSSAKFFAAFTQFYLDAYKKIHPILKGCALHDPLAVGIALYPELVRTIPMHIEVDLSEDFLGRTVENTNLEDTEPNTLVCLQVDSKRFTEDFFNKANNILSV